MSTDTPQKKGLLAKLKRGLFMTHTELISRVGGAIKTKLGPDPRALEALEEALIAADVGPATALELVSAVKAAVKDEAGRKGQEDIDLVKNVLKAEIERRLTASTSPPAVPAGVPKVLLMVGVNGTGKTTTTAKLAARASQSGQTVLLAAADTFRAAAIDQLQVWGDRLGITVIKHRPGADPAAVVHDACTAARNRKADCVFVDTAGRLQTKTNLMEELAKIRRIAGREIPGAPHEVLLVLDAVIGLNGLSQAREFTKSAGVTGLVLTKMDGTAKGGVILAIVRELQIPVKYIGVGETVEDLLDFDARAFAEAVVDG
ncbi:MAG: signal recognition particle-docking protein FtsY [Acidobacteria bacterium]|nr:signal recognition particle-docking protein FtsY [Acidobacteriota bacterium]MCG3195469.1 Signal recognition particle receptor FtsY [Thermoanaerobaculia bacterium]MCK6682587.1 signal recognition particle-docking protein FtsY [Thermoanaerobaculia bacterium]